MNTQESTNKQLLAIDLLKFLLQEYRRQSPVEFEELLRSTEFNTNPVPTLAPSDRFTWLGGEAALNELYQHTVIREEIFQVKNKGIFSRHFMGNDVPEEKLVIAIGKIGDALYLLNQLRDRSIHLLGRDAYLHRQVALHCIGEHGPLNANSLRKMISRGCIRSESRREELDLMIKDILWIHKNNG